MILRSSQPDPSDNKTISLFITSENTKDYKYIKSIVDDIYSYIEKQGGKKLPRESNKRVK